MPQSPAKMPRSASPVTRDASEDHIFFVDEPSGERFKLLFHGDINRLSVSKIRRYLRLNRINDENDLCFEGRVLSDDMRGGDFGLKRGAVLKLRRPSPASEPHQHHHHQQPQQHNNKKQQQNKSKKKHDREAPAHHNGPSSYEDRLLLNNESYALRFHIERVKDVKEDARNNNNKDGTSGMKLPYLSGSHSPSPMGPTSSETSSDDTPANNKRQKLLINKASSPAFSTVLTDPSVVAPYGRGEPDHTRPAPIARGCGAPPPGGNVSRNNISTTSPPEEIVMSPGSSHYIQKLQEMLRQAEALSYTNATTTNNNNNKMCSTTNLQPPAAQYSSPQYEMMPPRSMGLAPDSLRSTPAIQASAPPAAGATRPTSNHNNTTNQQVMEEMREVRAAVADMTGMLMEMKKREARQPSPSSSTTDSSISTPNESHRRKDGRSHVHHNHVPPPPPPPPPMKTPRRGERTPRSDRRHPPMEPAEDLTQRLQQVLPRAEVVLQRLLGALRVAASEPASARRSEVASVEPHAVKELIISPSQSVFVDEATAPTGRAMGEELRSMHGLLKELVAMVERGGGGGNGMVNGRLPSHRSPTHHSPSKKDNVGARAATPLAQDLQRVMSYTEHALADLVQVLHSQRSQPDVAALTSPRHDRQHASPDSIHLHSPRHPSSHHHHHGDDVVPENTHTHRSHSVRRPSPLRSGSSHHHHHQSQPHHEQQHEAHPPPSSSRHDVPHTKEDVILKEVHDIHHVLRSLVKMIHKDKDEKEVKPISPTRVQSQRSPSPENISASPNSSSPRSTDTRRTRPPPSISPNDILGQEGRHLRDTVQRAEQVIHRLLHLAQGQPNTSASLTTDSNNNNNLERKHTKRFDQAQLPSSGPGVGEDSFATTGSESAVIQQHVVEHLGSVQHMVEQLSQVMRSQRSVHDPSPAAEGAMPASHQFDVLPLPPTSIGGDGDLGSAQLANNNNNPKPTSQQQQQQQQRSQDGGVPPVVVQKRLKDITAEVEEVLNGLTQLVHVLEERGISPNANTQSGSLQQNRPVPLARGSGRDPLPSSSNVEEQPQRLAMREHLYTELPSQAVEVPPMAELYPGQSATLQLSTRYDEEAQPYRYAHQQPTMSSSRSPRSQPSPHSSRQVSGRGSLASHPLNNNNNNSARGSSKQLYNHALYMLGDVESILGDLQSIMGPEAQQRM